jgi:acyl-CoA thioester hydrolase
MLRGGMRIDDFTFVHPLRVRWAECDPQSVVFNANYFAYFDVAITEYWRAIGFRYPEDAVAEGNDLFAVKATAEFHAPARYDDVLALRARVARIGRSSMRVLLAIHRDDAHLTSGELIYVNADPKTHTSRPLPEKLIAAVLRYEKTAPER